MYTNMLRNIYIILILKFKRINKVHWIYSKHTLALQDQTHHNSTRHHRKQTTPITQNINLRQKINKKHFNKKEGWKNVSVDLQRKPKKMKDRWFWWSFIWLGKRNSFTLSLHEAFATSSSGNTKNGSLRWGPLSLSTMFSFLKIWVSVSVLVFATKIQNNKT